jgi:hypothetical protein
MPQLSADSCYHQERDGNTQLAIKAYRVDNATLVQAQAMIIVLDKAIFQFSNIMNRHWFL